MDKREVAKAFFQIIVGAAVGSVVDKTLVTLIPATSKFKTAEMTGMFAGWWATNKFQPQLDAMVDKFYDKRDARKTS